MNQYKPAVAVWFHSERAFMRSEVAHPEFPVLPVPVFPVFPVFPVPKPGLTYHLPLTWTQGSGDRVVSEDSALTAAE